jgi:hypothetical protein
VSGPADLRRSEHWHGVRAGDPVSIAGVKLRKAHWVFRAHVRNEGTGAEWIEVAGGREGDLALRSFAPERVFPVSRSRAHRPAGSLAEAPQLPLR